MKMKRHIVISINTKQKAFNAISSLLYAEDKSDDTWKYFAGGVKGNNVYTRYISSFNHLFIDVEMNNALTHQKFKKSVSDLLYFLEIVVDTRNTRGMIGFISQESGVNYTIFCQQNGNIMYEIDR